MRGITGAYFSVLLSGRKAISAFASSRESLRRFSLSRQFCYPENRQRFSQIFQHYGTPNGSLCTCAMDSARHLSVTCALSKSKDRGKDKKKRKAQHIDFNEMEQVLSVDKLTAQFEKTIEDLKDDFVKYLSVRSSVGAIEELSVKFEDKVYTLQELAQIARKPKLIVLHVSTFPQAIPDILQSLMKNQMKLNPQQDGTTIYIPIPKVTKEHRETLAKNAKSFFVKCCDHIRDVRNRHIKMIKQQEGLAKDLVFRIEGYIDALSQQYVSKAEQLLETKQTELLGDSE